MIADDESSPAVARQKTEKMVQEDNIDVHVGGFLSNICLACMPVWEDAKIVNMISVCLDTTLTTTKCNRFSFRVHDYAPAQAVAFGPTLTKMGKKWHIVYADYSWGQSNLHLSMLGRSPDFLHDFANGVTLAQLLCEGRLTVDVDFPLQNALVDRGQERRRGHAWIGRRRRVGRGVLFDNADQFVQHLNGSQIPHIHAIGKITGGKAAAAIGRHAQMNLV